MIPQILIGLLIDLLPVLIILNERKSQIVSYLVDLIVDTTEFHALFFCLLLEFKEVISPTRLQSLVMILHLVVIVDSWFTLKRRVLIVHPQHRKFVVLVSKLAKLNPRFLNIGHIQFRLNLRSVLNVVFHVLFEVLKVIMHILLCVEVMLFSALPHDMSHVILLGVSCFVQIELVQWIVNNAVVVLPHIYGFFAWRQGPR